MDPNRRIHSAVSAIALIFLTAVSAPAQQTGVVTGQVTAASTLEPLAGAQVVIPETGIGALTNAEGRYRLTGVPTGQVNVRVQLIGYGQEEETVRVAAGETVVVDFALAQQAIALNEIVVTGTAGGQRKRALGNVVSEVDAEEIMKISGVQTVGGLLKGRVPGVSIIASSGQVGAGPLINIRGITSFSLDSHPLIYIDGVRVDNATGLGMGVQGGVGGSLGIMTALANLDPDEIKSIEIIKGPAAATLYGTEASAGVIQIITKRGTPGSEPQFSMEITQGASWFRDPAERIEPNWGINPATGEPLEFNIFEHEASIGEGNIFQQGWTQEYGASVSGGSSLLTYYLSADYQDTEGIEPTNWVEGFSGRANFGMSPTDEVQLRLNVGWTQKERHLSCSGGCGGVSFSTVFAFPALMNTPYRGFLFGPPEFHWNWRTFPHYTDKLTYSLQATWEPTDWLSQRLIVGQDMSDLRAVVLVPRQTDPSLLQFMTPVQAQGSKRVRSRENKLTTFDYSATVSLPVTGDLTSNFSMGLQYYREMTKFTTVFARGFPAPGLTVTAAAARTVIGQDNFIENNTLGVYVQEQLALNGRLFFTGAVRVDNNSAFGREFDFVTYPKLSASWVVSDAPYFEVDWVDELRLRAAFGASGRAPEAFAALRTFQPVTSGTGQTALTPQAVGNAELAPERTIGIEAGFDTGLFDNRLGVHFTYSYSHTYDALLLRDIPPSSGFPGSQWVNAGEILNQGIEVGITATPYRSRDFGVNLALNLTKGYNEVLSLGGADLGTGFIASGAFGIRFIPGLPVTSWFEQVVVDAELNENGQAINVLCDAGDPDGPTLPNGTPILPGGPAVPCSQAPVLYIGNATPDFQGSLSLSVKLFRYLTLHSLVDWQTGFMKLDANLWARCQVFRLCEANFFPQRFDPEYVAQLQSGGALTQFRYNDASFAKLREISATLTFPNSWLSPLGFEVDGASFTLAGRNLFPTWTDWTGIDPEGQFQQAGFNRIEQNVIPPLAQVVGTFRITF